MTLGPSPGEVKARKRSAIAGWLYDRLVLSQIPLSEAEVDFLTIHLAAHPSQTHTWGFEERAWRLRGKPEGDIHPEALKRDLYELGWGTISKETDIPDMQLDSLYAFSFPSEADNSFVLTHPWLLWKDMCREGTTILIRGPPRSGKSQILLSGGVEVLKLKEDHIANGPASTLERIHSRAYRFFKPAGDFTGPMREREPEVDPAEKARRIRTRDLDLRVARDIAFVTNMPVLPTCPLSRNSPVTGRSRHIPIDAISGAMLETLERTQPDEVAERILPTTWFDEYDSAADARLSASKRKVAQDEFWRQHGHFGTPMVVVGHDEVSGISREVRDKANTIIEKPAESAKGTAIFFVSGLLNFKRFEDVDAPDDADRWYNPHGNSVLAADLSPYMVIQQMAEKRSFALERGEAWPHSREVGVMVEYILENRASRAKQAVGKDDMVWVGEALRMMEAGKRDAEVSAEIGRKMGKKPHDASTETFVRHVRRQFEEREAARAKGPREPEEVDEEADELGDVETPEEGGVGAK